MTEDAGSNAEIRRALDELADGGVLKIDVTGHDLYVRREGDDLIGVRYRPGQTIVGRHEKDPEFVARLMAWKGYEHTTADACGFEWAAESSADTKEKQLVTDGGRPDTEGRHWTFVCNECGFTSHEDTEPEALDAVDAHADYGPGHFDFRITDPDGVEQYP